MQPTSTLLLLLSAAGGLMAFDSDGPNPAYVELYRYPATNGSLVYLGLAEGSNVVREEASHLEERASTACTESSSIACSGSHTAPNNLCDQLVTELFADPTVTVGETPRQICFEADTSKNFCCVSWSKAVPELNKGDLSGPANVLLQQCTQDGISGKIDNTELFGVCTNVCLSDRGTGCS